MAVADVARGRRATGWAALRVVAAALWVVWALLAWWSTPRAVTVAQARHDIATGNVSLVERGEVWLEGNGPWTPATTLKAKPDGHVLTWRTGVGQQRYVAPAIDSSPAEIVGAGGSGLHEPTDRLAAELGDAAQRRDSAAGGLARNLRGLSGLLMLALVAGAVFVLVTGPAPVRGTRWFWFWVLLSSWGLGLTAWLAAERPWRGAGAVGRPVRRSGGVTGFVIMILSPVVVGTLAVVARAVAGPGAVPG